MMEEDSSRKRSDRHKSHSKHRHHRSHHSPRSHRNDESSHRSSKHRHHHHHHEDRERKRLKTPQKDDTNPVDNNNDDDEGEWVITADSGSLYNSPGGEEDQPIVRPEELSENKRSIDSSILNKLKASIMKAKMNNDTAKAKELEDEYNRLYQPAAESNNSTTTVNIIDKRFAPTKQQQETSATTTNSDPSVQDMLREELETRGQGNWLDKQSAYQIGRDSGFENDVDYQADKADELATITKEKELNSRNRAIEKTKQLNSAVDSCVLCIDDGEGEHNKTAVISLATRVYLCMAPEPSLIKGSSVIVPFDHKKNTLECDDDEWEEIRNFMKMLTKMWDDQGKSVIFYESAVNRSMKQHACIFAVPIPRNLADTAPGFFSEAILSSDDEWSSHRKIIDTRKRAQESGRFAFRTAIAKEAPYFHVWFDINGGIGHIVENTDKWPRHDLFARDVLGGMLQLDPTIIRKRGYWGNKKHLNYFEQLWTGYDWTTQKHE